MIIKHSAKTLPEIIKHLKLGGIIAFPTETVYGIWCLVDKPEAIKKIFELKKREKKALQLLFPYKNMIKDYGKINTTLELKIIKKCMPGEITLLIEKDRDLDENILHGSPYIGARIPNNPIILDILSGLDTPLVATSANITGEKDLISAEDIDKKFWENIPFIIDGWKCKCDIPSTVLKVENNEITIVRPGQLTKEDIEKKLA